MKSLYWLFAILQLQNHSIEKIETFYSSSNLFEDREASSFSKIQNYFQFFVELWKWNQMKSLYPIFPVTESHKENRNSSSFVKSPRRSRSLELLKNIKLLPILPRAMKMESNEIIISDFSQYSNYRITPQNYSTDKIETLRSLSNLFEVSQKYFQFFVELWKWNQTKSLYLTFRNTPITESHREDRNSSSFVKPLRRSRSLEFLKNYFQFFVELWKWNQTKSLYRLFAILQLQNLSTEKIETLRQSNLLEDRSVRNDRETSISRQ